MASPNARSLLQYWSHPYLTDGTRHPMRMSEWLGWVGLMLVLSVLGIGIAKLALYLLGQPLPVDRAIQRLAMHPSWSLALLTLCAPVVEELVFRAFMTREARVMSLGLGFAVATLALAALHAIVGLHLISRHSLVRTYFEHLAVLTAIALVLAALAYRARRFLQRWLAAVAPAAIIVMTLLFAAAHALNYERAWRFWLLWLTLPQLASGLVLAYLRVRHGLRWSIATHLAFDWLLIGTIWLQRSARTSGAAAHAALMMLGLLLFALFVYGVVFLFRRGVLRPRPAMA